MTYSIICFDKNGKELGYWIGENYASPNDSIGLPVEWGTKDESDAEMIVARNFAEKQGWNITFSLTKWQ